MTEPALHVVSANSDDNSELFPHPTAPTITASSPREKKQNRIEFIFPLKVGSILVVLWAAGQQIRRSILHMGHGPHQNSSHLAQVVPSPV